MRDEDAIEEAFEAQASSADESRELCDIFGLDSGGRHEDRRDRVLSLLSGPSSRRRIGWLDLLLQVHAAGAQSFDELEPNDLGAGGPAPIPGAARARAAAPSSPPSAQEFSTVSETPNQFCSEWLGKWLGNAAPPAILFKSFRWSGKPIHTLPPFSITGILRPPPCCRITISGHRIFHENRISHWKWRAFCMAAVLDFHHLSHTNSWNEMAMKIEMAALRHRSAICWSFPADFRTLMEYPLTWNDQFSNMGRASV
jgi:hypothetical protein